MFMESPLDCRLRQVALGRHATLAGLDLLLGLIAICLVVGSHISDNGCCPTASFMTTGFPLTSTACRSSLCDDMGFASRCRPLGGNEGHQSPLCGDQGPCERQADGWSGAALSDRGEFGANQFCVVQKTEGVRQLALFHLPHQNRLPEVSQLAVLGMAEQARGEDVQRQG
jgi:hypothetical protein